MEAAKAYQEALKLQKTRLDSYNNLAVIMREIGQTNESEKLLKHGLSLAAIQWKRCKTKKDEEVVADHWGRLLNSSNILALKEKQYQQSISLARQQIQLCPNGIGYVNLGVALEGLGYPSKAEKSHLIGLKRHDIEWKEPEELVGKKLHSPSASSQLQRELSNLALCRLNIKPLSVKHWKLFLSRLGLTEKIWSRNELPWQKLWKGEYCKKLLIWDEQGYGDALQCLRWIEQSGKRTQLLTLMLRPSLLELIKQRLKLPPNCNIIPLPTSGPRFTEYEKHCPLMGLPVALADGQDQIPTPKPPNGQWLKKVWAGEKKVGLVWAAGVKATEDFNEPLTDVRYQQINCCVMH